MSDTRALVRLRRLAQGGDGIPDDISLAAFVMLVLRDEETGAPVELQPYHYDLIAALTAHRRLVVLAHVESGKTQIGAMWLLWQLGRNHRLRMAVICESMSLSRDIVRLCGKYIGDADFEGATALHAIFHDLLPGDEWKPGEGAITVQRKGAIKDASIKAFSSEGGITGRRVDAALLDDCVTPKTTATPYLRGQQTQTFFRKIFGRVVKGGAIVFFTNAQFEDDCSAVFASKRGVHEHVMAVTVDGTATGASQWPARWPDSRIAEYFAQNPDAPAQLLAIRRKQSTFGRFTRAMTDACLEAGRGLDLRTPAADIPSGYLVCIGVDFAFSQGRSADRSAIVAVLRYPDGRRELLHVAAGKWREADGLRELASVLRMYPKHRVRAESNGGQRWIIESWAERLDLTIEPYRTDGSKWSPVVGIPALAADMGNHRWIFPCDHLLTPEPMVSELIAELHAFDPDPKKHTGDLVMALFFADGLARDCRPFEYLGSALGDTPALPPVAAEVAQEWSLGAPLSTEIVDVGSLLSSFR